MVGVSGVVYYFSVCQIFWHWAWAPTHLPWKKRNHLLSEKACPLLQTAAHLKGEAWLSSSGLTACDSFGLHGMEGQQKQHTTMSALLTKPSAGLWSSGVRALPSCHAHITTPPVSWWCMAAAKDAPEPKARPQTGYLPLISESDRLHDVKLIAVFEWHICFQQYEESLVRNGMSWIGAAHQ